jgi:hypothetical protein
MIQENPAPGISQVQMEGIVPLLWTYIKFLSKRPVQNIDGEIETPENSGFHRPEVPQQSHRSLVVQKPNPTLKTAISTEQES